MTMSTAIKAKLASGDDIHTEILWHMVGRNRSTGAPETLSLWTGAEDRIFTVDGINRTYLGDGSIIQVPPISYQAGIEVQYYEITLSGASPSVREAFFVHDMRFAKVEMHVAFFTTDRIFIDLWRPFKGSVAEPDLSRASVGGNQVYNINCVTTARDLTIPMAATRSHEGMQITNPGDNSWKFTASVPNVEPRWEG